jgi:hypothetical protein
MFAHHDIFMRLRMISSASERISAGGAASSTKWKARLSGLRYDIFYPVAQYMRRQRFIALYVVQGGIAKSAFAPVAAMRHGQLIPPAIAPQPVHRVHYLYCRYVIVKRQVAVIRRTRPVHVYNLYMTLLSIEGHMSPLINANVRFSSCYSAFAVDMFQQLLQRRLAIVQRYKVDKFKYPRHRRAQRSSVFG